MNVFNMLSLFLCNIICLSSKIISKKYQLIENIVHVTGVISRSINAANNWKMDLKRPLLVIKTISLCQEKNSGFCFLIELKPESERCKTDNYLK